MDTAEMPGIMKDYKQLHANKTDGLEDMSKVLERKCTPDRGKDRKLEQTSHRQTLKWKL